MRPGCGSLRSPKWFLVAHSLGHCPKSCLHLLNYAVATEGAKQKPNLAMKQTPVSVSLAILLRIYFHDSLHHLKVFFVWRMVWNAPFPLYNLSCLPLSHSIYHGHQAAQLCHGYYSFLHLPKYLSRGSPKWIYFIMCYRSLRGSLFLGKTMSSISSGLMKALRCLSTNRCHWCNFSCGLRFYSFVI